MSQDAKNRRRHAARYRASPKGRAAATRYNASPKGRALSSRARTSRAGRAAAARYCASPNGKAVRARYQRVYRTTPAGKAANRRVHLKATYGMALEDYAILLKKQNGHCALCARRPTQERHGVLLVDHDHVTNKVRGLLCYRHNQGLGALGDNERGMSEGP